MRGRSVIDVPGVRDPPAAGAGPASDDPARQADVLDPLTVAAALTTERRTAAADDEAHVGEQAAHDIPSARANGASAASCISRV